MSTSYERAEAVLCAALSTRSGVGMALSNYLLNECMSECMRGFHRSRQ